MKEVGIDHRIDEREGMEEVGIEQDRGRDEGDEEGMEEKGLSRMVERDGFFKALRSEDVSPPPVLRAPTWGCCSTGSCYIFSLFVSVRPPSTHRTSRPETMSGSRD